MSDEYLQVPATGQVEVLVNSDLSKKKTPKNTIQSSREDIKLKVEIATLIVVFAYTSVSFWQGCQTRTLVKTAQDTYSAVDRPYVGLSGIPIDYVYRASYNSPPEPAKEASRATEMAFTIVVKNFGSVPAMKFTQKSDIRVNGEKVPSRGVPDQPKILFPGQEFGQRSVVPMAVYPDVLSGKSVIQIDLWINYSYSAQHYGYCEREQYYPRLLNFINLGDMCGQPWAKGESNP